jgi:hypothetical protein
MKNNYIKPAILVREITRENDLLSASTTVEIKGEYTDDIVPAAKENTFSSSFFSNNNSSNSIFGDDE